MSQRLLREGGITEYADSDVGQPPERVLELEDRILVLEGQIKNVKRDAVVLLLNILAESMRHIASGKLDIPETVVDSNEGKWGAIKQRLAPRLREAVDLLLTQGGMRRTQIAAALKMDYANCAKNVIGVLIRQGLIEENSGMLSLKKL